ncbi:hypothetical protein HNR19_002927 [Nocardioides thalensis]|uniref:Uncharacterized protein n=1 Tax=Nocardioides thalensis TaxID=1914755 RepID=A0A853C4L8_9ACTN|nr:hypothetical protein [Nocardioides thalensis]NYJ02229.1 hypothetical protein [Nocardioides thalensis]
MKTLTIIVLIATPLLAFAGGLVGHLLLRRGAKELDRWRKREETMRLLRWAVELATDPEPARAQAGITVLGALLDSELLDAVDVELVATVAGAIALGVTGPPPLGPPPSGPPPSGP